MRKNTGLQEEKLTLQEAKRTENEANEKMEVTRMTKFEKKMVEKHLRNGGSRKRKSQR